MSVGGLKVTQSTVSSHREVLREIRMLTPINYCFYLWDQVQGVLPDHKNSSLSENTVPFSYSVLP